MITSSLHHRGTPHLEPLSIGQGLFHPGSKEYGGECQDGPGDKHEYPVSLQQPLSEAADPYFSHVREGVEPSITDLRYPGQVVRETPSA